MQLIGVGGMNFKEQTLFDDALKQLSVLPCKVTNVIQSVVKITHDGAGLSAVMIAVFEDHQVLVVWRLLKTPVRSVPDRPVSYEMRLHVMLNKPGGPFGNVTIQSIESAGDVITRVDTFADVMQQRCEQELFVVWKFVASKLKDLQTVVQYVTFGVILFRLFVTIHRK
jgi:hypothetical protein